MGKLGGCEGEFGLGKVRVVDATCTLKGRVEYKGKVMRYCMCEVFDCNR